MSVLYAETATTRAVGLGTKRVTEWRCCVAQCPGSKQDVDCNNVSSRTVDFVAQLVGKFVKVK